MKNRKKMETNQNKKSAESLIKDIKRKTNRTYSSEEKIRIVIEGMRGEESVAAICRKYGINESLYYKWSKDVMEAGKKRLSGDTERHATPDEVQYPKKENDGLTKDYTDLGMKRGV